MTSSTRTSAAGRQGHRRRAPGRGRFVERLIHKRPDGRTVANAADMDFFKRQKKIVLRNCGVIDPLRIEDYIARTATRPWPRS